MRRAGWVLVLAAVLAALVPVSAHAATSPLPLRATNWVLRDSTSIDAVFDRTRVQGANACNRYRAPYTVRGSRMSVGPEVIQTKVDCPDIDPDYEARLVKVATFRIRGTTLTLRDASGRTLLVYRASVGKPALRGGWTATGYYSGDAVQSVVPGSALTLELAGARASGNTGCNTFDGGYTVRGVDRIGIGPLRSTRRACTDPALNDQETHYLAALELAVRYRVTGGSLTLYRPGGTIAATFERASGLTSGT